MKDAAAAAKKIKKTGETGWTCAQYPSEAYGRLKVALFRRQRKRHDVRLDLVSWMGRVEVSMLIYGGLASSRGGEGERERQNTTPKGLRSGGRGEGGGHKREVG